jgi:hypothetical protein
MFIIKGEDNGIKEFSLTLQFGKMGKLSFLCVCIYFFGTNVSFCLLCESLLVYNCIIQIMVRIRYLNECYKCTLENVSFLLAD